MCIRIVRTTTLVLSICGPFAIVDAHAQATLTPSETASGVPKQTGRNVIRLDLLAPLIANIEQRFDGERRVIFPALVSYERHLSGKWSAGIEILVWGGTPANRRSGATLLGRWYVLPVNWQRKPLSGLYLSPVLSYRVLSTTAGEFDLPVNRGKRVGGGLLLGWQVPLFPSVLPNLLFDGAVGVVAWTRLGDDRTSDPTYYAYINEPIFKRTGILPDVRYGLGYRF